MARNCGKPGSLAPHVQKSVNMEAPGFEFGHFRSATEEQIRRVGVTLGSRTVANMQRFGMTGGSTWKAGKLTMNRPRGGEIPMPKVSGATKNGDGSALAGVEVRAYYIGGEPTRTLGALIQTAMSDGSGLWSMDLAPGFYQFDGYLFGSPDKAGTTKVSISSPSTSVSIILRDPTSLDPASGSAVYRPIGSPIVRRLES